MLEAPGVTSEGPAFEAMREACEDGACEPL